jgi:hypothetical protein
VNRSTCKHGTRDAVPLAYGKREPSRDTTEGTRTSVSRDTLTMTATEAAKEHDDED